MAEVVELKRVSGGTDGGRSHVYFPVVVFRTAVGQKVRVETKSGYYPPSARVGERVEVIYDPATPRNVMLYRLREVRRLPWPDDEVSD
jgi:hypothetical protein